MWLTVVLWGMGLMTLLLLLVVFIGARALQSNRSAKPRIADSWPSVSVIVPAAGTMPDLADCLASLMTQDYPDYEVILVTRDQDDPAVPIIREAIEGVPRARHVISGQTVSCGQKNHNLLAGVRAARPESQVLVFGDSIRSAPPDWLKWLVEPIVNPGGTVVTGYHHVYPQDAALGTVGRAISTLFLFLMQAVRQFVQPWGGSTAITRKTFDELDVAGLWAGNVVDDVSLAALLKKHKIPVTLVSRACLTTRLPHDSLPGWRDWLMRQWLYLKYCFPLSWLALALWVHLMLATVTLTLVFFVAAALGYAPPWLAASAACFWVAFLLIIAAGRRLHPAPAPWLPWIAAFIIISPMGSLCHFLSMFTNDIRWHGFIYRVTWSGRVLAVREIPH